MASKETQTDNSNMLNIPQQDDDIRFNHRK